MRTHRTSRRFSVGLMVMLLGLLAVPAHAEDAALIPQEQIADVKAKVAEAAGKESAILAKLAYRRVAREAEALLEKHPTAPNRFEVLSALFEVQKALLSAENSVENRKAFFETAQRLAQAPNEYAEIRLDADLLITQAVLARQGAGIDQRAQALRPLVDRYRDTSVEKKVLQLVLVMAVEFGAVSLIDHLCDLLVQRYGNDPRLIAFQRNQLPSRVFGAPFIATLPRSDGTMARFPMDYLGKTTALFFWSKADGGEQQLEELASLAKNRGDDGKSRLELISVNLDDLPDAGESIVRKNGLDWPVLSLPGGRKSVIYQAYVDKDPKLVTVSPTGIAALFLFGGNTDNSGYQRWLRSSHGKSWTDPYYGSCIRSLLSCEFLILDPMGSFDPARPPELKALSPNGVAGVTALKRTGASVPEPTLQAIQACFIQPPARYAVSFAEAEASYKKADELCRKAIAAHPDAPDLWIVRNRRIVALMGLWKTTMQHRFLEQAAEEAATAIGAGYPEGTDVIARLCIARQSLHSPDADPAAAVLDLVPSQAGAKPSAPSVAAATLLAFDVGDRPLFVRFRRELLDHHADNPATWPLTAFLLDSYHRYWFDTLPFVSGHIYERRESHGVGNGMNDDAERTVRLHFKTLDGKTVRIPEDSKGKWAIISFVTLDNRKRLLAACPTFAASRPLNDILCYNAVLGGDAEAVQNALGKQQPSFPTLIVPDGLENPIVRQLGFHRGENVVVINPEGKIATVLSGLKLDTLRRGNPIPSVIEWYDEATVDRALAEGDLEKAKRIAFTYAPPDDPSDPDAKKRSFSMAHRRGRAKVFMAMGEWKAALADLEIIHSALQSQANGMSMRTEALEQAENMLAEVRSALDAAEPETETSPK